MNQRSQTRIPKKRAISQAIGRNSFSLQVPNRFFYQLPAEKGLLAGLESESSAGIVSPPQIQCPNPKEPDQPQTHSSFHNSSRKSQVRILQQAYSLPQIKKKLVQQLPLKTVTLNQILKSELGCFNYFEILEKRQQSQRKRRDFLTRNSSYISEDDTPNQLLSASEEQESYEEYDKRIMEIQFNLEKGRRIRFTHKANWSIAK